MQLSTFYDILIIKSTITKKNNMALDFTMDLLCVPTKNERSMNYPFDGNTLYDLSEDHEKLKIKRPKPLMTCVVCGDHALGTINNHLCFCSIFFLNLGYNFDAVSCESCKAFFRRNALRPPVSIRFFSFE